MHHIERIGSKWARNVVYLNGIALYNSVEFLRKGDVVRDNFSRLLMLQNLQTCQSFVQRFYEYKSSFSRAGFPMVRVIIESIFQKVNI